METISDESKSDPMASLGESSNCEVDASLDHPVGSGESDEAQRQPTSGCFDAVGSKPLSKHQLKKLKRRQYWESVRQEKRKDERRRRQERKRQARERGQDPTPSHQKRRRRDEQLSDVDYKATVSIDMSFDDLMAEKDARKAFTQIQYSYSANRRAEHPLKLYVTNFAGKTRRIFDRIRGCTNWDENCIQLKEQHFLDVFKDKDRLIYLTSESPNVLTTLESDAVYVIGGLVDHNAHKGLCHRLAEEKGLRHARLPIDEYVVMKSRRVLTINQVFEIMLKYTESEDWEKAFFDAIPKRKEVSKKVDN